MIDASRLTQEDADEYRIDLVNTVINGSGLVAIVNGEFGVTDEEVEEVQVTLTNQDALELAAQLLIGAVYNASDADWRALAWQQLLRKRIREAHHA